MPRRDPYVPKHRGPHDHQPVALKKGIRKSVMFSGVALAATGIAVSSGIVLNGEGAGSSANAALASSHLGQQPVGGADRPATTSVSAATAAALGDRTAAPSRSDRRTAVDPVKKAVLDQKSGGQVTETEDLTTQDPRTIAQAMLPQFGFSSDQFSCLDALWTGESGWNIHADNPSSSAYGIPQALPGSKMATAGADWENNAATQIRWGLGYIRSSYGSPCSAEGFKQGHGWY